MDSVRKWGSAAKAWYIKWSPWIAGYCVAFLVLFFLGAHFAGLGNVLLNPSTVGWVTAMATFAAAIVALHIASSNHAREEEKALREGELYTATLERLFSNVELLVVDIEILMSATTKNPAKILQIAREIRTELLSVDIGKIFVADRRFAATAVNASRYAILVCQAHANGQIIDEHMNRALDTLKDNLQALSDYSEAAFNKHAAPWLEVPL